MCSHVIYCQDYASFKSLKNILDPLMYLIPVEERGEGERHTSCSDVSPPTKMIISGRILSTILQITSKN